MNANAFWHFLTLGLWVERSRHIGVILLSVMILFLLSSVLFLSASLRFSLQESLKSQPDFVVSAMRGGVPSPTPIAWIDEIIELYGVSEVSPRVYGRYFFAPKEKSFLIIGVDFMEEQSHKALKKLINTTELKTFLNGQNMIVGEGVKAYLNAHFYPKSYQFLTPKGDFEKVSIFQTLPSQANLIANDMMIMPLPLAQKILGYSENEITDITLNVPNPDEWNMLSDKLLALHYDLNILTQKEVAKSYQNLYNYKGGIFLILFLVTLSTFSMILYQRYNMLYSTQRREIGLLRALGWSINDLLKLKMMETLIIVIFSYIIGVSLAYFYVFIANAPWLKEIFLGGENLKNSLTFVPVFDFTLLSSLFLLYAVPFIASVIVPVWRVAVTDPKEAML